MRDRVELVLFDLGGVLIEVPGVQAMLELTGTASEDDLWRRWLTCRWVRSYESGECTESAFAAGVVSDWGLAITPEAFLAAFVGWPTGPFPGATELVERTRQTVPVACFSNTNASHWYGRITAWPLIEQFEQRFLSFELGLLKPDVAAFEKVAGLLDLPASRVLFLDDNALNVEGAAAAGFQAVRAVGVEQARDRLVSAGVLAASAR